VQRTDHCNAHNGSAQFRDMRRARKQGRPAPRPAPAASASPAAAAARTAATAAAAASASAARAAAAEAAQAAATQNLSLAALLADAYGDGDDDDDDDGCAAFYRARAARQRRQAYDSDDSDDDGMRMCEECGHRHSPYGDCVNEDDDMMAALFAPIKHAPAAPLVCNAKEMPDPTYVVGMMELVRLTFPCKAAKGTALRDVAARLAPHGFYRPPHSGTVNYANRCVRDLLTGFALGRAGACWGSATTRPSCWRSWPPRCSGSGSGSGGLPVDPSHAPAWPSPSPPPPSFPLPPPAGYTWTPCAPRPTTTASTA
jgi:hypothetical protein